MKTTTLVLGLLAICSILSACHRIHHPEGAVRMNLPTGKPLQPQGMRALEVKPGAEPFTRDDVTKFIQTHRLGRSIGDISQLRADSLEFLPAREATSRLQGASSGLTDEHQVGLAIIRGPLYFTGPPPSKPIAFASAYALFDAKTGNLLMSGALDKAPGGKTGGQSPAGHPDR